MQRTGRWREAGARLAEEACGLAAAGAEAVTERNLRTVGLLATAYTMEGTTTREERPMGGEATGSGYAKVNLMDVEDAAPANGFGDRWEARVARVALGAEQTGVTHFRLRAGRRSPFSHRHAQAEEIYVILSGAGRMKLDEEFVVVGPGDAIRVGPEVARAFEAGPDGLEFLAFGPHHPGDGTGVDDPWVT